MSTDQTLSQTETVPTVPPDAEIETAPVMEHEEEDETPPGPPQVDHQNERSSAEDRQKVHMLLAHSFLSASGLFKYLKEAGDQAIKKAGDVILKAVQMEIISHEQGLERLHHLREHSSNDHREVILIHAEAVAETFQADELKEIIIFLESSLGQKLMEGTATVRNRGSAVTKAWLHRIMDHVRPLQEKVTKKEGISGLMADIMMATLRGDVQVIDGEGTPSIEDLLNALSKGGPPSSRR